MLESACERGPGRPELGGGGGGGGASGGEPKAGPADVAADVAAGGGAIGVKPSLVAELGGAAGASTEVRRLGTGTLEAAGARADSIDSRRGSSAPEADGGASSEGLGSSEPRGRGRREEPSMEDLRGGSREGGAAAVEAAAGAGGGGAPL